MTLNGEIGGLSPDGRTLVLGGNVHPDGTLRSRSRFAVVDTGTLALRRTIHLHGDYSSTRSRRTAAGSTSSTTSRARTTATR